MAVSDPCIFMKGEYFYRQIDDLAMNLCVAKTISDAAWQEYLDGSFAISQALGRGPSVSLVAFVNTHPNAVQRRMATAFVAENRVRRIERLAAVTDSELLRGAMTALSWLMPQSTLKAFKSSDAAGACQWLHQVATFDQPLALATWREAKVKLGVR